LIGRKYVAEAMLAVGLNRVIQQLNSEVSVALHVNTTRCYTCLWV